MSKNRAQGSLQAPYYVFNAGHNQGFVIISGDDRVETVLGYAEQGAIYADSIPPAMADLLDYYAEQIEDIRNGASPAPRRAAHAPVTPFMTVKWNQTDPYNGKTPLGYYTNKKEGVHTVTGCVATAMAQVLYHQHYVNATQAEIAGYKNLTSYKTSSGTTVELTIPTIPKGSALDWANMVDSYDGSESQAQKDAVANLMLYCGAAVKMNYRLPENGGSTASISSVPDAFKKYFGYSRGIRHISRSSYKNTEWDDIIYKEVAEGRPVIYQGLTAKNAGHAFLLHGYDSDGKYAVNWGWGGNLDGNFYLDNLTTKQGGYNYKQEAVISISNDSFSETVKATVTAANIDGFNTDKNGALVMPTKTVYSATKDSWGRVGMSLAIAFKSNLANFYTMDCGYGIHRSNGQLIGNVVKMRTAEFNSGTGWTFGSGSSAFGGDLSEGTYYIKGYSKQSTASDWLLCDDANKFAVKIVVTASTMTFRVTDISSQQPDPEVSDADRAALAATYASLESAASEKHKGVQDVAKAIAAAKPLLDDLKKALAAVEKSITNIDERLKAESQLSAVQKDEFKVQLNALDKQKTERAKELADLAAEIDMLDKKEMELQAQLEDLLTQISKKKSEVAGITTSADLEASQTWAQQTTTTVAGIDLSGLTAGVKSVNRIKDIILTTLQTGLSNLVEAIDKAVADATIEAAKAEMKDLLNNIITAASDKVSAADAITKSLADMKTALKPSSDEAIRVQTMIDVILLLLEDKYLTEAQKKAHLAILNQCQEELDAYKKSLDIVTAQIATVEMSNATLITKLQDILKAISDLSTGLDAATTKADIDDLKLKAAVVEESLKGVDAASVSKDAEVVDIALKTLSLEDTTLVLYTLHNKIQEQIDTAKAEEEKAKEEAEKLEKAKETYKNVTDKLEEVIKTHQEIYELLFNAHADFEAKMKEIDAVIIAMKQQYADIEKALAELIAKQPTTRADDDPIAKLQERLKQLADNIALLESQYQQVSALIANLEDQLKKYAELIAATTETRDQLQNGLASTLTAAEVDSLSLSAAKIANELATVGATNYKQFIEDYDSTLASLNEYIGNINTVYTQANTLQKDVADETTSIQSAVVDESEVSGRYDMKGNRVDSTYKGMQIIRLKNGKTIKINVK